MDQASDFVNHIFENRNDPTVKKIFADYLADEGYHTLSNFLRDRAEEDETGQPKEGWFNHYDPRTWRKSKVLESRFFLVPDNKGRMPLSFSFEVHKHPKKGKYFTITMGGQKYDGDVSRVGFNLAGASSKDFSKLHSIFGDLRKAGVQGEIGPVLKSEMEKHPEHFARRRPLYSRQVPFGQVDVLWRNQKHKSGLNQSGRILQKFVAGHTPEDPIHILSKAALHGDSTALGALHDHLDEINHPYSQLNWRGVLYALQDEKTIYPSGWPGYFFKADNIVFDKPNARKMLDRRLEEKQFADNRARANNPEQKRRGKPSRNASYKAPAGGLVSRGTFYEGGKMLPLEATQTAPRPESTGILQKIVSRLKPKKKKVQKTL